MSNKLAIVIGRFSLPHIYHFQTLIAEAVKYDRVLILIGSSFQPPTVKNPFSFQERVELLELGCKDLGIPTDKISYAPLKDYPYSDNRWLFQVQREVDLRINQYKNELNPISIEEIVLIGVDKDDTTYYLKKFPQWETKLLEPTKIINATDARDNLFGGFYGILQGATTHSIYSYLVGTKEEKFANGWISSPKGKNVTAEWNHRKKTNTVLCFKDEKGNFVEAPYKPIAYCTDAVVTWRGHILLIQRKSYPGKDLWALPGGHLNTNEWIKEGAVRELQEETKIFFYAPGNKTKRLYINSDWCKSSHEFDYPSRSQNGRKITRAFHWVIPDEFEVFIEAADDAKKARWFPFYDVLEKMDEVIFEDHQSIIAHMILGPSL